MSFLPWSRKPDKSKAPKRDGGKPKDQKGGGKPQGSRSPRGKKGAPPPPQGLTLDQKHDIAGILLVLGGLRFLAPRELPGVINLRQVDKKDGVLDRMTIAMFDDEKRATGAAFKYYGV